MPNSLVARAATTIDAPESRVFDALIDPKSIKAYMFGATVTSDWREGSPISWKGKWEGKTYEDKGRVVEIHPPHRLKYTHFSPLAGKPDAPENYHNVVIDLSEQEGKTLVALTQDRNATEDARAESQKNWEGMLAALKKHVESNA